MSAVIKPRTGAHPAAPRAGRFELRKVLGKGAQATVWLGWDPRLEREVAVKIINPEMDAASVVQWLDEARAVSRLAHPNIVPVFEADQDGAVSFMVFELVTGPTLSELLRKRGRLPEREAATLMRDVLDALATAHGQGIVHRDLKPSNILIDAQGRPRVMDFGIAARVSDKHDGRIVGSPGYIAPEAVTGAAPNPLMDVFAVGMMLGQMIIGRPMLEERDPYRALERITKEDLKWPAERGEVDAPLRTLIMQAVARDPLLRPESARSFRDALVKWLDPAPVATDVEHSATFEFLLRRMRHKSDFPALSDAVVRIQKVTQSEGANLHRVTDEIVRDVALTNKLLRMVNSAHFRSAGGGTITSVPRAVALFGLSGIRTMALSLVLLEHMQDKQHVQRLKETFLLALMTGTLVDELTPSNRVADEPFLAGLMSQLGRMLTEFYFPEESLQIRRRIEPHAQHGEWSREVESRAVNDVLGLGYDDLGQGVAGVWGLPESLRKAIVRPEGEPPTRVVDHGPERLRWSVMAAGEMAQTLMLSPPEAVAGKIAGIGERFARALDCRHETFEAAVHTAQAHLLAMSKDLGLDFRPESRARRLMPPTPVAVGVPGAAVSPGAAVAPAAAAAPVDRAAAAGLRAIAAASDDAPTLVTGSLPAAVPAAAAAAAAPAPAAPSAEATARALALEQGIASVTHSLAGDSFRLNEVLRTILESMHKAIGFRCVLFGLRDPKTGIITGRFGLGEMASALSSQMRVDVNPNAAVDLLSMACRKGADTLIADARAANVASRLPTWLQKDENARSFILLPMTMKNAPFALIYADRAEVGGINMGERELSLVRTLRNQAVMAFKTAT